MTRIDPRSNTVLAKIPLTRFRASGAATGGGSVWVSDVGENNVWRIDPARNVAVATVPVGAAPIGVASGYGSIWVANSGDGTVSRIDADLRQGNADDPRRREPERRRRHGRRRLGDRRLGGGLRRQPGWTCSTAARKRSSFGPIPAADSASGARSTPRARQRPPARRASISAITRSTERISVSVISALPSLRHAVRRRLHREHDASLEVLLRSLELCLGDVARGDVGDLLGDDLEAGRDVLLACAHVDADVARVRVLARERVDRVGHPTLLADLLEEARGRRAAEDGVEERGGEAPTVGA